MTFDLVIRVLALFVVARYAVGNFVLGVAPQALVVKAMEKNLTRAHYELEGLRLSALFRSISAAVAVLELLR